MKESPWNFEAPPYDERSSCFVNAGTRHGVGKKQPVGHQGNPKQDVATLPRGRMPTLKVASTSKEELPFSVDE